MDFVGGFDPVTASLLVLALALGLVLVRLMRIRRWRHALSLPTSQFASRYPKAKSALLKEVRVDLFVSSGSKDPLFEILYMNFRLRPGRFDPAKVGDALSEPQALPAPKVGVTVDVLTAEEKVQSLLSAQNSPQISGAQPVESLAQNLIVNLVSVATGKKKLKAGVEHAVLDSLGAGGGFAGAKIGGAVGVAMLPVLAGAAAAAVPMLMILGAWAGSVLGKKMSYRMKARHRYAALKRLRRATLDLKRSFLLQIPELRGELDREYQGRIESMRGLRIKRRGAFSRVFFPDLMTVFLEMGALRCEKDWAVDRAHWSRIRRQVRAMPPFEVVDVVRRLKEAGMVLQPQVLTLYREYEVAFEELKKADQMSA